MASASLSLNVADDGSTINVDSTAAGTQWEINGGMRANEVILGGPPASLVGRLLDTIQGIVSVNGRAGPRAWRLTTRADLSATTFTIGNGAVSSSNAATVSYASVKSLILDGGSGANTFTLSPDLHNLDELATAVTINGGGASTAVFDDQSPLPRFVLEGQRLQRGPILHQSSLCRRAPHVCHGDPDGQLQRPERPDAEQQPQQHLYAQSRPRRPWTNCQVP